MRFLAVKTRRAFTLVELLVVMSIMVTLAAIALVIVPDVMDQDRTTDGASTLRQVIMIAKGRAVKDNLPRGVRFITGADPNNPERTNPNWCTELQYIESPAPIYPNPSGSEFVIGAAGTVVSAPYVEIEFNFNAMATATNSPGWNVYLMNLPDDARDVIVADLNAGWFPFLVLPDIGAWPVRLVPPPFTQPSATNLQPAPPPRNPVGPPAPSPPPPPGTSNYIMKYKAPPEHPPLDDSAGTTVRSYSFAILRAPRPLIGEPTVPLPKKVCVDLSPNVFSAPGVLQYQAPSQGLSMTGSEFDLVFAPNGQVLTPSGVGQIFLWVRDYTKTPNPLVVTTTGGPGPPAVNRVYDINPFKVGGEQQIVAMKTKSGALGVFPVAWPDNATGVYPAPNSNNGNGPYSIAQTLAASP